MNNSNIKLPSTGAPMGRPRIYKSSTERAQAHRERLKEQHKRVMRIVIPEELHKALRERAAETGLPVNYLVIQAIAAYLKRRP